MSDLPKPDRIRLHSLLRASAEPWIGSSVEPIIIGWYQYRSRHPNDNSIGTFRLQYGARAWSTGAYSFGGIEGPIVPKYQAQFEQQAITLREAKWDRLSATLLRPDGLLESKSERPDVEMLLLIEKFACRFGVRSRSSGQEKYFRVTEAGLEPDSTVPKVWFDAWPEQRTPPVFRPLTMPSDPNRQNATEVKRHVDWWYQTPLMPSDEANPDHASGVRTSTLAVAQNVEIA